MTTTGSPSPQRGLAALSEIDTGLCEVVERFAPAWSIVSDVRPFGDGHSGFTYSVDALDPPGRSCELVLRVSPAGARIAGPADVGRQGRIMAGLAWAALPVPEIVASSSDPVLAGRSFLLARRAPGGAWPQARQQVDDAALSTAVIDVLDQLQRVRRSLVGMGDDDVMTPAAEVARWMRLLRRAPDEIAGPAADLAETLAEQAPPTGRLVVTHGDFHFGNVLFEDARVSAVVDWEVAAVGDPLVDRGSLVVAALRRDWGDPHNTMGDVASPVETIMELGELGEAADSPRGQWFTAAACFKYAAIFGHNLGLHRSGRRRDPIYEDLVEVMHRLVRHGRTAVG